MPAVDTYPLPPPSPTHSCPTIIPSSHACFLHKRWTSPHIISSAERGGEDEGSDERITNNGLSTDQADLVLNHRFQLPLSTRNAGFISRLPLCLCERAHQLSYSNRERRRLCPRRCYRPGHHLSPLTKQRCPPPATCPAGPGPASLPHRDRAHAGRLVNQRLRPHQLTHPRHRSPHARGVGLPFRPTS